MLALLDSPLDTSNEREILSNALYDGDIFDEKNSFTLHGSYRNPIFIVYHFYVFAIIMVLNQYTQLFIIEAKNYLVG